MKYPWAVVGAKVVCVDAREFGNPNSRDCAPSLSEGVVYTIAEVRPSSRDPDVLLLALAEVPNPSVGVSFLDAVPWAFNANRFAPVRHVNTDATVAALRQATIDAVNNASGGLGIKRRVGA